jgi:hypothetical protein
MPALDSAITFAARPLLARSGFATRVAAVRSSAIRDILEVAVSPGIISLAGGRQR